MIQDYLSKISDNIIYDKQKEQYYLNEYMNFSIYSNETSIKSYLRMKLLDYMSKLKKKNITKIDTFYLSSLYNFGNNLIAINNCIFYCEILGCHNIILDKSQKNFFINETIILKESKITIRKDSDIKCNHDDIICLNEQFWYIFYQVIVLPEIRIHLLKNEILKNLPEVKIESDSLYIHIREGDIFLDKPLSVYAQPPFCFYDKIIYNLL